MAFGRRPKDLNWQDCAVKIPDWKTCRKVFQSPSQRSCDKAEHCSRKKQHSLCLPLDSKKKKKRSSIVNFDECFFRIWSSTSPQDSSVAEPHRTPVTPSLFHCVHLRLSTRNSERRSDDGLFAGVLNQRGSTIHKLI
jgi:hypothetical protein